MKLIVGSTRSLALIAWLSNTRTIFNSTRGSDGQFDSLVNSIPSIIQPSKFHLLPINLLSPGGFDSIEIFHKSAHAVAIPSITPRATCAVSRTPPDQKHDFACDHV
jgi:hypothetical protein